MNDDLRTRVLTLVADNEIKIEVGGPQGWHEVTEAEGELMLRALCEEPVDPQEAERLMRMVDAAPDVLWFDGWRNRPFTEPEIEELANALSRGVVMGQKDDVEESRARDALYVPGPEEPFGVSDRLRAALLDWAAEHEAAPPDEQGGRS